MYISSLSEGGSLEGLAKYSLLEDSEYDLSSSSSVSDKRDGVAFIISRSESSIADSVNTISQNEQRRVQIETATFELMV